MFSAINSEGNLFVSGYNIEITQVWKYKSHDLGNFCLILCDYFLRQI